MIWKRDRKIMQQTKFLFWRFLKFPPFCGFAYLQFEKCLCFLFFFLRPFFDREWPSSILVWHVPRVLFTLKVSSILLISVATQDWIDKPLFTHLRNKLRDRVSLHRGYLLERNTYRSETFGSDYVDSSGNAHSSLIYSSMVATHSDSVNKTVAVLPEIADPNIWVWPSYLLSWKIIPIGLIRSRVSLATW